MFDTKTRPKDGVKLVVVLEIDDVRLIKNKGMITLLLSKNI